MLLAFSMRFPYPISTPEKTYRAPSRKTPQTAAFLAKGILRAQICEGLNKFNFTGDRNWSYTGNRQSQDDDYAPIRNWGSPEAVRGCSPFVATSDHPMNMYMRLVSRHLPSILPRLVQFTDIG